MSSIYVNLSYNAKYNLWHYSFEEQRFQAIGYKLITKNISLDIADIFTCYIDEKYCGEGLDYELIKSEYKAFIKWCSYIKNKYVCQK